MAQEGGVVTPEVPQAFLDALQNDLKNLSAETKKKYPQIKEVGFKTELFMRFLLIMFLVVRGSNK